MERAVPLLPIEDMDVAREFYVDRLGFGVRFEFREGHVGMIGIERGGIVITLDCPMEGHGRNVCVSLEVEDADAYYQEWSTQVNIERPPCDEEWGARTFGLNDPFANTIFVMGPLRKEQGSAVDGGANV